MKKLLILNLYIIISFSSFSQNISYKDLIFIMNSSETEKIDELLTKKGYLIGDVGSSNDCDSFVWNFKNLEQRHNNIHIVQKMCDEYNNRVVTYSTTNPIFYQSIKNEVIKLNYKKIGENTFGSMLNVGYEKGNYRFQFSKKDVDLIEDKKYILNQYLVILRVQKK